jgi:5-methylcytosine-specific restriction endonuclease McrA
VRETDEWQGKTDDAAVPPRVQVRVFGRDNGRCKICTRKVGVGGIPFQLDHRVALVNGGSHRESNLQIVCVECHKGKTKQDVAVKAKTARVRKRHLGIKKPRSIRAWRKFNGEPVYASRERS